jgi:tRNA (guanine37-N1)-methyltransferase
MRIDIISVAPELIQSPFEHSILKRAQTKGLAEIHFHSLRDYAVNRYGKIDDYQFGGGAGMVLMMEPIDKCISQLMKQRSYDEIIYLTPDAPVLDQGIANRLSGFENLILLTGHYKGVDQRVRDRFVTLEISIGDYVLSGGELAAAVLCDAVVRLIPGVLGDETSALSDSFQDGLLAPPVYTRPAEYDGLKVPEILLSGNFPKIEEWRHEQSVNRTLNLRPDLLDEDATPSKKDS